MNCTRHSTIRRSYLHHKGSFVLAVLFTAAQGWVARGGEPDCDADGIPDPVEIAACRGLAECDDCNGNQVPDGCDIAEGSLTDCDDNDVPDLCDLVNPRVFGFVTVQSILAGDDPRAVATGDWDLDGDVDLAVAAQDDDHVGVFLNPGDGNFGARAVLSVADVPTGIAAADLDGDGDLDLAVTCIGPNTVNILLNLGNGTFAPANSFSTGVDANAVVASDLDGDGDLDLAMSNTSTSSPGLNLLFNDGDGDFFGLKNIPQDEVGILSLAAADLDGDGDVDLIAPLESDDQVVFLYNDGAAEFPSSLTKSVGELPRGVLAADLDSDGDVDVATADYGGTATVIVNLGEGLFLLQGVFDVDLGDNSNPRNIAAADLNNDSHVDLILGTETDHDVRVLLNNGDASFGLPIKYPVGMDVRAVAAADLDNDADADVISINADSDDLSILFNTTFGGGADCDGNLVPDECDIQACPPNDPSCSDCNANGVPDGCDVAGGASDDCDFDETPDECQLSGIVPVTWIGGVDAWSNAEAWCPQPLDEVNNGDGLEYDVAIGRNEDRVTLDISPTLRSLVLAGGAEVEVNDQSGASSRTLAVDGDIFNRGVFRAANGKRFTLDTNLIDQAICDDCDACGEVGILEAVDDGQESATILEIKRATVIGGILRTAGNGRIHLIDNAELQDVCVQGVVVPGGHFAAFSGEIVNHDVLSVAPNADAKARFFPQASGGVLRGNGVDDARVTLESQTFAELGDLKNGFTNGDDHGIDGTGIIYGDVVNEGRIEGNRPADDASAGELILSPPGKKTNLGELAADGGTLRLSDDVEGEGTLRAENGLIRVLPDEDSVLIEASQLDIFGGGVVEVSAGADVIISGVINLDCISAARGCTPPVMNVRAEGTVYGGAMMLVAGWVDIEAGASVIVDDFLAGGCFSFQRGCTPPVMNIRSTGELSVEGDMYLLEPSELTAEPSATVLVAGDLDNQQRVCQGSRFELSTASLMLTGALSSQQIEVGGLDVGPIGLGYFGNYAVGTLQLTGEAVVDLKDDRDNQQDDPAELPEALYAGTLIVESGSTLNTNGLAVYYREIELLGSVDDLSNLIEVPPPCGGDANNDGVVDPLDSGYVLSRFGCSCGMECAAADTNGDGAVDPLDVGFVQSRFGDCP